MTIGTTSIWRVRTGGNDANGGGFDPSISGAGTDYSQQDAAQWSSSNVTSSGTTITDTTAQGTLTTAMIGNAIAISGASYFVLTVPTANTLTVDRAPGATALAAKLGGGWATPLANLTQMVAGNTCFIRGSGNPNPTSDDYVLGAASTVTLPSGDFTSGKIRYVGENGRPRISSSTNKLWIVGTRSDLSGLIFAAKSTIPGSSMIGGGGSGTMYVNNCAFDQNGFDVQMLAADVSGIGNEVYSSIAPGSPGTTYAVDFLQEANTGGTWNIHDTVGHGATTLARLGNLYQGMIIANCRGIGLTIAESTATDTGGSILCNCTIDGNLGGGIVFGGPTALQQTSVFNNIISNHATSGTFGISGNFLTTAQNDRIKGFFDFNTFWQNNADLQGISHGANDKIGLDPQYAAQATEGYNVGTNMKAAGYPQTAFLQSLPGMTATQAYIDMGGVQRQEGGGAVYNVTQAEAVSPVDAVSGAIIALAVVTEAGISVDAVSAHLSISAGIAEAATAQEALVAMRAMLAGIGETISAQDAYVAVLSALCGISELSVANDIVLGGPLYNVGVAEAASAEDTIQSASSMLVAIPCNILSGAVRTLILAGGCC